MKKGRIEGKAQQERKEKREEKGIVTEQYKWTDKAKHPPNLHRYEELNKDPEVSTAITVLTDMVYGGGIYTEMAEEVLKEIPASKDSDYVHPNKKKIDEWSEDINLDEKLIEAIRAYYEKGFCPVEILEDNRIKLLPPETFYIYRTPKGTPYKYTQESGSSILTYKNPDGSVEPCQWIGDELKNIILFVRKASATNPYGEALCETIWRQLDTRNEIMDDLPDVIHKQAYPFRVWIADKEEKMNTVFDIATAKEPGEDIFLGNLVLNEDFWIWTEKMDPRVNVAPLLDGINFQISEGLFAPLLMYLRNATEASATKMMEAIERSVEGTQRYFKRRVEHSLYKLVVAEPIPRLQWGSPRTGLEDIPIAEVQQLLAWLFQIRAIDVKAVNELIRKIGIPLPELSEPSSTEPTLAPQMPMPFAGVSPNLQMSLKVVEDAYAAQKITFSESLTEGEKIITVYIGELKSSAQRWLRQISDGNVGKKLSNRSEQYFQILHEEHMADFRERLLPTHTPLPPSKEKVISVKIN